MVALFKNAKKIWNTNWCDLEPGTIFLSGIIISCAMTIIGMALMVWILGN